MYNKSRRITVSSYLNSSETNNPNTSNSDDVIGNSNLVSTFLPKVCKKYLLFKKKMIHSQLLV